MALPETALALWKVSSLQVLNKAVEDDSCKKLPKDHWKPLDGCRTIVCFFFLLLRWVKEASLSS